MTANSVVNKKQTIARFLPPKMLSFGEKIAKIGPADPEIICLREIIKKEDKRRKNERN